MKRLLNTISAAFLNFVKDLLRLICHNSIRCHNSSTYLITSVILAGHKKVICSLWNFSNNSTKYFEALSLTRNHRINILWHARYQPPLSHVTKCKIYMTYTADNYMLSFCNNLSFDWSLLLNYSYWEQKNSCLQVTVRFTTLF